MKVNAAAQAGTPEPRSEVSSFQGPRDPRIGVCLMVQRPGPMGSWDGYLPVDVQVGPRASDGPLVGGAPGPQGIQEVLPVPWWVALSLGPSWGIE